MNNDLLTQLETLHKGTNGVITIVIGHKTSNNKDFFKQQNFPYKTEDDINTICSYIDSNKNKSNIWLSVNSFNTTRKNDDVSLSQVFICEYDYGNSGHNNSNQPFASYEEAKKQLIKNFKDSQLPPTLIVHSGNGIHCYWRVDENIGSILTPDEYKGMNEKLFQIGLPDEKKFKFFNEVKDYARILRVVGTNNLKDPSNPKEVTLLRNTENIYTIKEIKDMLNFLLPSSDTLAPQTTLNNTPQNTIVNNADNKDEDFIKEITISKDDSLHIESIDKYIPKKLFEFLQNDLYINPYSNKEYRTKDSNGKVKHDRSAKDFYIFSALKNRGFEDNEILLLFETYANPKGKFKNYSDKQNYIVNMSKNYNGYINTDYQLVKKYNFLELKKNNLFLNKTALYQWFIKNIDEYKGNYIKQSFKNGFNVKKWNSTFWEISTQNNITLEFRNDFIKKGIGMIETAQFDEFYFNLLTQVEEPLISDSEYLNKISISFKNGTLYVYPSTETHDFKLNWWDKTDYNTFNIEENFYDELITKDDYLNTNVGNYLTEYYSQEELKALQMYLASVLIPSLNIQKALFIYGSGGNGKSVLINTFTSLLNSSASSSLNVSSWGKNHVNLALINSIVNISNELTSREVSIDDFKKFISQDDTVFNPKYGQPIELKLRCKHIFTVNSLPNIAIDKATMRRMMFVKIIKDTPLEKLSDRFRIEFEKNKIHLLNFVLRGLLPLIESEFTIDYSNPELKKDVIDQNEPIADFVEKYFDYDATHTKYVSKELILELFDEWLLNGNGAIRAMTPNKLTLRLNKYFESKQLIVDLNHQKKQDGKNTKVCLGLDLNENGSKLLRKIRDRQKQKPIDGFGI